MVTTVRTVLHSRRESDIEADAVELIDWLHGVAPKFGVDGWPDRIVVVPGADEPNALVAFAEAKRAKKDARKRQAARIRTLNRCGVRAFVFRSLGEFVRRLAGITTNGKVSIDRVRVMLEAATRVDPPNAVYIRLCAAVLKVERGKDAAHRELRRVGLDPLKYVKD